METGEVEVVRKAVGYYKTQLKAFKRSIEALRLRDANPGEAEGASLTIKAEELLQTHFR